MSTISPSLHLKIWVYIISFPFLEEGGYLLLLASPGISSSCLPPTHHSSPSSQSNFVKMKTRSIHTPAYTLPSITPRTISQLPINVYKTPRPGRCSSSKLKPWSWPSQALSSFWASAHSGALLKALSHPSSWFLLHLQALVLINVTSSEKSSLITQAKGDPYPFSPNTMFPVTCSKGTTEFLPLHF